ncbi:hypothetical protein [Haloarcula amylovorans]|uniref:hypothetical protein n=1 Tax=Haloarcula amylovorans TaxID=2562280 RepID=UPI001076B5B3|nr:hypothetical protein [Halomicroarcula amylolytica]
MPTEMTLCQSVPPLAHTHIDDMSIGHTGGDEIYARGIEFHASGRTFNLLDKDGDGEIDFAFSYGVGPEWCVDHDAIPEPAIARLEMYLEPLDLTIPEDFRA